jgi:drug/metabolite transporter (DMT)-like permease
MGAAGWAVLAAVFFALGLVLQQKGTLEAPPATSSGFLRSIFSKPVWLAGGACQILGWVGQGIALDEGQLFLVQPLLSLQVVFALPLGAWITNQQVGRREWLGALAVVAGLGVFLAVSDPAAGRTDAPGSVWVAATVVVAGVAAGLALVGRRAQPATRAAVYGAAGGVLFGYQAAVMKVFVQVVPDGLAAMATDWSSYALLASALSGFYFVQISLQAGALAPAIASTNVANPITSVTLGRFAFLETPQRTAGGKIASLVALGVLFAGLISLAGGQAAAERSGTHPAPRPS